MILSKDRQMFVKTVGILIAIQGVTWFGLSVAGIVVKHSPPDKMTQSSYSKYADYLARIIYDDFMLEGVARTENKVIRPSDFQAFLWIYAVLSSLWVFAALDLAVAISFKKTRQSYISVVLGIVVIATSVIDFVFFALLARDFSTCPFNATTTTTSTTATTIVTTTTAAPTTEQPVLDSTNDLRVCSTCLESGALEAVFTDIDCQVADGIVMSLAARGYALWLVNIILAVNLIRIGVKVRGARTSSPMSIYSRNTIPRAKVVDRQKSSSPNNGSPFYGEDRARGQNGTPPLSLNHRNAAMYY